MAETIRGRLRRRMFWSNTTLVAIAFFGFVLPPLLPLEPDTRRLTMAWGPCASWLGQRSPGDFHVRSVEETSGGCLETAPVALHLRVGTTGLPTAVRTAG
jgi:hypothetical protein